MNYDNTSPISIETFAKKIEDKTLREVVPEYFSTIGGKGRLGQLVETQFFGYDLNSLSEADFAEAGIELKVCPIKKIKKKPSSDMMMKRHGISAKERIIISIINYENIVNEKWETASFRKKMQLLLMFYLHDSGVDVDEQIFKLVSLWEPNEVDMRTIQKDWEIIQTKVLDGKAHEISEGDTMYLGACTKGATKKSVRKQPFSNQKAMQRAFSLKRNYVDFIFEELFLMQLNMYQKEKTVSEVDFFTDIYIRLNALTGNNVQQLMGRFEIVRERKAKNYLNLITKDLIGKLFGKEYKRINELEKSGIELKCILLGHNGTLKESMSYEQINYCEIIEEEWFDSTIRDKFENKKHLWIVFRATKGYNRQSELELNEIIFEKAMYWNMPIVDLEKHYHRLWKDTVEKIKLGKYNEFMKISDNSIGHVRPKGKNVEDVMITPQGTYERKKCFWLNAKYVANQIKNTD